MILRHLALLLALSTVGQAQTPEWDTTLCPELIKSGFLPKLTDRWLVQYKFSTWTGLDGAKNHEDGFEAFDSVKKRSGYEFTINGDWFKTYQIVSDYENQKSYKIHKFIDYYSSDACVQTDLVNSSLPVGNIFKNGKAPIGPMLIMYVTGSADNPGVIGARQVDDGQSGMFRDLTAVNYAGCYFDATTSETLKFSWFYTSLPGTKYMMPLGATVTISKPNQDQYTYLRYDFVSFDSSEQANNLVTTTKVLEIPTLYRCNVSTTKTFPDASKILVQSYAIEYITYDPAYTWMKQQTEKYNYNKRHYWERDNVDGNGTMFPLNRMSDYSTGVRYNLNRYTGTCHASPLDFGLDSAAKVYDDGVCLKEPQEMFGDPATFSYDGPITLRGIDCDVWTTDVYDSNNNLTRRVQWCFATNTTISGSHPTIDVTPVLLILAYRNEGDGFVILNQELFSFQTSEPPLYAYDVSECFRSTTDPLYQMRHFVIRFPNSVSKIVTEDPILFKSSFIKTVSTVGSLTEVRITNVLVENSDSTTDVTFSILPPAPIPGKLSPTKCQAQPETSITDAYQKLDASVKSGTFIVELSRGETVNKFTSNTDYDAIYELPRRVPLVWYTGISSTVLAILGAVFAVLGFASGVLIYLYLIVPKLIPYLRLKNINV